MQHPIELQRRNMIEYQQIDINGKALLKKDGTSKVPDYINNLFMEEYREKLQAEKDIRNFQKQLKDLQADYFSKKFTNKTTILAKEDLADAQGDMLICIAGAIIEHRILYYTLSATIGTVEGASVKTFTIFSPKFLDNPFKVNDVIENIQAEKIIQRFNEAITPYEKAILLENLWFGTVNEARQNNFDIEGIYNAIAENNLERILRDENGVPITDENGKIMRKNMHPDLKPFIL